MKIFPLVVLFFIGMPCNAQRYKIDSMNALLQIEKTDSNKVFLLWNLAQLYQESRPDTALLLAQQANSLAIKTKNIEGQSRSLNQIANAFNRVGNYPLALEYYIKKLKIEEGRNNPENLAIAYMNIATVLLYQQEYRNALNYTFLADEVSVKNHIWRLRKYSLLNLGDIYEKFNKLDSAMYYTNLAYDAAKDARDDNMKGASLNNFANILYKFGDTELALKNYRKAMPFLLMTGDDEVVTETYIGLAKTFFRKGVEDSALNYGRKAYYLSKSDGFLSKNLEATILLRNYFDRHSRIDSAYKYQNEMQLVKDSINSGEKIKLVQQMALTEQVREKDLAEKRIQDQLNRNKILQYIGIGVLIPIIFLFTLYLRKRKIKPKSVEFLGLISLLMFFEYITVLLHPVVLEMTYNLPLFEVIISSFIAALLTRTHHSVENWFLKRLTHSEGINHNQKPIKIHQ